MENSRSGLMLAVAGGLVFWPENALTSGVAAQCCPGDERVCLNMGFLLYMLFNGLRYTMVYPQNVNLMD